MKKLMLGNQAVAQGAYEGGVKVSSAYPGTPSTEISEYLKDYDVYAEWAPNEKVALEVAVGASISGARAMCAMKHVGLNVAADPLFTAGYTGVNGGLVICVADDPGMHSSQNEQDSRHYAKAAKVAMLEPADSSECKEFTRTAFSLSEQFDVPVILRLCTRISHSQSLVEIGEREDVAKEYKKDPMKYVMMPGMAIKRHVVVEERQKALAEFAETCPFNKVEKGKGKIGVITSGTCYQYVKEALGDDVSVLKLGMVYPLPPKLITDFVNSVETCYVIEELDPFIEEFCRQLGLPVIGKEKFTMLGEYNVEMIKRVVLGEETGGKFTVDEPVPARPPVMCAGCPHRGMFYVLHKLKLTVTGDIGCYTLGALPPLGAIDACVCMGASINMAHGFDKGLGDHKKTVAIIGDSTFMHSGITGLVNVVYNQGNSTVIILDNSITGMTGHQDNPTTGKTLKGEATAQVNLVKLCEAVGIKRVTVCDPFDVDNFEKVVKEEVAADEPSVIISQRPCALLKTVKYTGKMAITDKCKNCKMCLQLGCPAIAVKDGRPVINESQCNGCGLCQNVCRFGAMVKKEA